MGGMTKPKRRREEIDVEGGALLVWVPHRRHGLRVAAARGAPTPAPHIQH